MTTALENFNFIDGVNITQESIVKTGLLEETIESVAAFLDSNFNNLDHSSVSGLYDINIRPSAMVAASIRAYIAEFAKSRSISSVFDGSNTSDKIVDEVLSNFFLSRKVGSKSRGYIRITISDSSNVYQVLSSSVFTTAEGLKFLATKNNYITKIPSEVGHIRIFESGVGSYGYFMIEVEAEENGDKYNIPKNTQFLYEGNISDAITYVADKNFNGGIKNEDSKSMASRLVSSLSSRGLFSPMSIESFVREKFDWAKYISVQGTSSRYMHRNVIYPYGGRSGCACDIYVSPVNPPSISKTSLVSSRVIGQEINNLFNGPIFKVTVSPAVYPAHIDIESVSPRSNDAFIGSYVMVKKERYLSDYHARACGHKMPRKEDAIYTSFYSTDVFFSVPDAGTEEELAVDVLVLGSREIKDIQDIIDSESYGSSMVDSLVRIAAPCFVHSNNIVIRVKNGENVSTYDILNTFSNHVLSSNPIEGVKVDRLISDISSMDGVDGVDMPLLLEGNILSPAGDNKNISISSMTALKSPVDENALIGPGLIQFVPDVNKTKITKIML